MGKYVTRGGDKLDFALQHFGVDAPGKVAADLGSNIGGFVDCLLQYGAARVYSVDTSYGTLAWKLRQDPRVVVMERTNALHVELPEKVDLITIDVAWTRQALILPHALTLTKGGGVILSLLKPQYEATTGEVTRGVVPPEIAPGIAARVVTELATLNVPVVECVPSPLSGGAGNREFFLRIDTP